LDGDFQAKFHIRGGRPGSPTRGFTSVLPSTLHHIKNRGLGRSKDKTQRQCSDAVDVWLWARASLDKIRVLSAHLKQPRGDTFSTPLGEAGKSVSIRLVSHAHGPMA